jgi:hypothetical protein
MLCKVPSQRMTLAQAKAHPWFAPIDWEALAAGSLQAPPIPELEVRAQDWKKLASMCRRRGAGIFLFLTFDLCQSC